MPLPAWPDAVPFQPLQGSYAVEQPFPAASVTQFEDGPDRMRRRSYTSIAKTAWSGNLDGAEAGAFEDFAMSVLNNATSHFLVPVVFPGKGYVQRRAYIENGAYKLQNISGDRWSLTFTLCVFRA